MPKPEKTISASASIGATLVPGVSSAPSGVDAVQVSLKTPPRRFQEGSRTSAAGLLPSVHGLQVGRLHGDPARFPSVQLPGALERGGPIPQRKVCQRWRCCAFCSHARAGCARSLSGDNGERLPGQVGAHRPVRQAGISAGRPCMTTPLHGRTLPTGKRWAPWEDQPGSMSVANRLWSSVFGNCCHGSANAAHVLLCQFRTLAGRARREHIDYGNEDEP